MKGNCTKGTNSLAGNGYSPCWLSGNGGSQALQTPQFDYVKLEGQTAVLQTCGGTWTSTEWILAENLSEEDKHKPMPKCSCQAKFLEVLGVGGERSNAAKTEVAEKEAIHLHSDKFTQLFTAMITFTMSQFFLHPLTETL